MYALTAPSTSMAAKVTLKAGLATEVEQQLVQEMRVLRTLVHPNIIRMHASHETDEKLSPDQRVECSRHIATRVPLE